LLQRVICFSERWFEPIPNPGPQNWLGLHPELMQTFEAFKHAFGEHRSRIGPSPDRHCMHLMPLGPGEPEPTLFAQLRGICAAFFTPLRVAVLRQPGGVPAPQEDGVIDADEALLWITAGLRSDSALTVALTDAPLSSDGAPTIGASDWTARVGVFSLSICAFAQPRDGSPSNEPRPDLVDNFERALSQCHVREDTSRIPGCVSPATALLSASMLDDAARYFERVVKLVVHQAVHLFGVLHCCYYRCVMNGSSSMNEFDNKPPYVCGMCLKKLNYVVGFDPLDRYAQLAYAWSMAGREDISRWYGTRVSIVRGSLSCYRDGQESSPSHLSTAKRSVATAMPIPTSPSQPQALLPQSRPQSRAQSQPQSKWQSKQQQRLSDSTNAPLGQLVGWPEIRTTTLQPDSNIDDNSVLAEPHNVVDLPPPPQKSLLVKTEPKAEGMPCFRDKAYAAWGEKNLHEGGTASDEDVSNSQASNSSGSGPYSPSNPSSPTSARLPSQQVRSPDAFEFGSSDEGISGVGGCGVSGEALELPVWRHEEDRRGSGGQPKMWITPTESKLGSGPPPRGCNLAPNRQRGQSSALKALKDFIPRRSSAELAPIPLCSRLTRKEELQLKKKWDRVAEKRESQMCIASRLSNGRLLSMVNNGHLVSSIDDEPH